MHTVNTTDSELTDTLVNYRTILERDKQQWPLPSLRETIISDRKTVALKVTLKKNVPAFSTEQNVTVYSYSKCPF